MIQTSFSPTPTGVQNTRELARVAALPRRSWGKNETRDLVRMMTGVLKRPQGQQELLPIQAIALFEFWKGSIFAPAGCGSGKTLVAFLAPFISGSRRPLLIMPAKLIPVKRGELREYAQHWPIPNFIRMISAELTSTIGAKRLLEEYSPDLIVIDECFTGETPVLTPYGEMPIAKIEVGDLVIGADGREKTVEFTRFRDASNLIEVMVAGRKIETTTSHPFLTSGGWVEAGNLRVGDEVVRMVPDAADNGSSQSFLLSSMRDALASCRPDGVREDPQPEDYGKDPGIEHHASNLSGMGRRFFQENAREQSDAPRRRASQAEADLARNGVETADSRRQRSALAKGACDAGASPRSGLGDRLSDRYWRSAISKRSSLQDRSGECCAEDGDRDRRGKSPIFGSSACRPGEGRVSYSQRLVRVEAVERRRGEVRRVYNLQVEDETYVAGGCVVHNCHMFRNARAARTKRLTRYLEEHPTRVALMTGTLSKDSLLDYAHFLRWALHDQAPIPLGRGELQEWAEALDEKENERSRPVGYLRVFMNEEERREPDEKTGARKAFRRRLTETPGVVATSGIDVECSLSIQALEVEPSPIIDEALELLIRDWVRPDLVPIEDALELRRHGRALSLGLYTRWDPAPPAEWMARRKDWASWCRYILVNNRRDLDSELEVTNAVDAGLYPDATQALTRWREIRDSFTPNPVPTWLSDEMLEKCAAWAHEAPGIVWCEQVPFAERLAKLAKLSYYGAGSGQLAEKHDPRRSFIASINSISDGLNLQGWNRNLVTNWPANASKTEQMISRTHRRGQRADEVTFDVLLSSAWQWKGFGKSLRQAQYLEHSTGQKHRILYADKIMPSEDEILSRPQARWQTR